MGISLVNPKISKAVKISSIPYTDARQGEGAGRPHRMDRQGSRGKACCRAYDRSLKKLWGWAWAKERNHDLPGALTDYTRAIELDPNYASAYSARGVVKDRKGDLKGVLADFNQASELEPKYATAYVERAEIKIARTDYPGPCPI